MSEQSYRLALLGNPNSGKTTLFNVLTGTHQRVGNWPGVTVEKKEGTVTHEGQSIELIDLPGTYSLQQGVEQDSLDQQIAQSFVRGQQADVLLNIVDASALERGLYLTTQALESGVPVVVALNMMDVAEKRGLHIDCEALSRKLGCVVVPIVASKAKGLDELLGQALRAASSRHSKSAPSLALQADDAAINARYERLGTITSGVLKHPEVIKKTATERLDDVFLHPVLAFPIFLGVMYLMFMFTINVGSAFIDVFDGVAAVLFVEAPRIAYESIGLPAWLTTLLADGLGGGIQLVASFIPIIGGLFLFQSFLEASGYMARAAFIVDRLMSKVGLPGKSFVPLIVGFGCNVPAVMGARTMERYGERLQTVLMAPFMSCGARLTVYVLFATVFFPHNAENVIFALYLIGIALAVISALLLRKHLLGNEQSSFILELPNYHFPNLKSLFLMSWQRLKGFVLRAGKAIVAVVVVLNFVNSMGVDGSFGNQDSEQSMLSEIGRTITPVFEPIGVQEDNWPATVGIFTGIFAKEVVVGTLDALYGGLARQNAEPEPEQSLAEQLAAAFATVPANLYAVNEQWGDPLGVNVGDLSDGAAAAEEQGVSVDTLSLMRDLFVSPLAAFSYLLFVLLYMPCVATLGAIYKELGAFWAIHSASWNTLLAYAAAVFCYQGGQLFIAFSGAGETTSLAASMGWIVLMIFLTIALWKTLIHYARSQLERSDLIPVVELH